MRRRALLVALMALSALGACTRQPAPAAPAPAPQQEASIVPEAQHFMTAYAADLTNGDRLALAERYDRSGAYLLGEGRKELRTFEEITNLYLRDWNPPAAFAWHDLSYEQVGPDAVLVLGRFSWTLQGETEPLNFSYSALLRRQEDGQLRIRMEDESRAGAS
jgi:hypothetical protein